MEDKFTNQAEKKDVKKTLSALSRKFSIYLVLLAVIIVSTCLSSNFTNPANIVNIMRQISVSTLVAYGATILIINGMIDLSAGSVIALSGVVGVMTYVNTKSVLLSVIVSVAIGGATGIINGLIITKLSVPAFITTMAMQMAARGLVLLLTDAVPIYSIGSIALLGKGSILGIPTPIFFMILLGLFTWFLLNYTTFGRYIYAVGGNEEAAKAAGIKVSSVRLWACIYNGLLTGLAGIILMGRLNGGMPQAGQGYEFDAISAAVLGGTSIAGGYGTVSGTVCGAFILGIFNNILNLLAVDSYLQQIIKGGVIVLAVAMDTFQKRKQR